MTALSVRNDASVTSVARAVRRNPPRSSAARGVTATVSNHRPAANGSRTVDSASSRMMASPPGAQLSAVVRMEKGCMPGEPATTSVPSNIDAASATASRRSRSTSRGSRDAATTSVGRATSPAIHNRASLIVILRNVGGERPRGHHRVTEPLVEACEVTGKPREGVDNEAIENAVEESAFDRDQKQAAAEPSRCHPLEIADGGSRSFADSSLQPVQVVQDVRSAEELQQSETPVADEMDERDRVPPHRDLHDDEAHLREGGIGER